MFHVKQIEKIYDVVVIGAGHAGVEAALISAKIGAKTLLLTLSLDSVALMPCNSAIGGPGRGHLVREIDAIGGHMAKNVDKNYMHLRMLNVSRGPAVKTLRAIVDKRRYLLSFKKELENQKNLELRQGLVAEIERKGELYTLRNSDDLAIKVKCIVVCTGTFLRAKIFWGDFFMQAGRHGEIASVRLAKSLERLGFGFGRLKTDTPPRLDKKSIDFNQLQKQLYDDQPPMFSYDSISDNRQQECNYITYVEKDSIDLIKKNLNLSSSYSGDVLSEGPKYCPSIEDKIKRFPDKPRHMLFIQPEGYKSNEMYLHGFSTTFSEEMQINIIRKIKGLENAKITRPGYGVEYDYLLPSQIYANLESKKNKNIFFAGQINGTTGYEEAASQGIIAGINAALSAMGKNQIVLKRTDGYIGVLIDDLIVKEISQPYRMLTSRNEFRLIHRHDNADLRMIKVLKSIGNIRKAKQIENKYSKINNAISELKKSNYFKSKNLMDKIMFENLQESEIFTIKKDFSLNDIEIESLLINIKYQKHIKREEKRIHVFEENINRAIPKDLDYKKIKNLSSEAIVALESKRPQNMEQALRIEGVNMTDVAVLFFYLSNVSRETIK